MADGRGHAGTARALLADIGGTKTRFALAGADGEPRHTVVLKNRDHADLAAAARHYLGHVQPRAAPRVAAFSVACPVEGDRIALTNFDWEFSVAEMRRALDLERLEVVNDFVAVALSVPHLKDGDRRQLGGGAAVPLAPIAVLGPGTGLGVSGLAWTGARWLALATEGGHVTMAAGDDHEAEVLACLRRCHGHVSAERVVSGPGLANLHAALAECMGARAEALTPDEITARAKDDPLCRETTQMFAAMLGTVAGNLALSIGAHGGAFIGGGVVPRMGAAFDEEAFRRRFEAKGRMGPYNAAIPTYLITRRWPAFLGLGAWLSDVEKS